MQTTLDICRWVYNKTLEVRKKAWEERQESLSLYDTTGMLPKWKQEHPFLKKASSQVLQEVCRRVDFAFQHFFRRCRTDEKPGYPRFKSEERYKHERVHECPHCGFELDRDHNAALNILALGLQCMGQTPRSPF